MQFGWRKEIGELALDVIVQNGSAKNNRLINEQGVDEQTPSSKLYIPDGE
jgi:hypothetical protein